MAAKKNDRQYLNLRKIDDEEELESLFQQNHNKLETATGRNDQLNHPLLRLLPQNKD